MGGRICVSCIAQMSVVVAIVSKSGRLWLVSRPFALSDAIAKLVAVCR